MPDNPYQATETTAKSAAENSTNNDPDQTIATKRPKPSRDSSQRNPMIDVARFVAPIVILAAGFFGFRAFGKRPSTDTEKQKAITQIRDRLTKKEGELTKIRTELTEAQKELGIQDESDSVQATSVKTAPIELFDKPFVIQTDGESVSYRIITVPAEVAGRVIKKAEVCRGGSFINEGTVLFELDTTDYQLEIERLTAQRRQSEEELKTNDVDIANNRSLLKLAEEDLSLQNRQLDRIRSLRKQKAATESDMDAAEKQQLTARNAFQTVSNQLRSNEQRKETIKATLDLMDAQIKKAKSDLERTKVVARTSATVVDDLVEEGNYVKAGDPLVHLSDSSRMEIKCNLQGEELGWVWRQARMNKAERIADTPEQRYQLPPTPCEVVYSFEGVNIVWDGVLSRYEGTGLDTDTRMVPCRVLVTRPADARVVDANGKAPDVIPPSLLSGMYVTVRIPIRSPITLLKVPVEAVRPGGQLWIARKEKLHLAQVVPVHTENDFALIRQDAVQLDAGDRVIVSPLPAVAEGMALREAAE